MGSIYKVYSVKGTVKFCAGDIMADSLESAKDIVSSLIDDLVTENLEIMELDGELVRDATKEEVVDGFGEDEWED